MAGSLPTGKAWTLRLRRGKQTVLVFADPTETLQYLKETLLQALQTALPDNLLDGHSLPQHATEIWIAKPNDLFDITQGFTLLDEEPVDELASDEEMNKFKSRSGNRSRGRNDSTSLIALGIKENHVLAFRFTWDSRIHVKDTQSWNFVVPTLEDIYGVENEGDLGAISDFRG